MNPTTNQLIFALIVLMVCLTIAMLTRRPSVRASIQRQRDEWARSGGAPDHAWIDDSASFSANVVSFLWSALGVYLAIAIVLGDLLWVVTLFH
jgi:hypothetical protein